MSKYIVLYSLMLGMLFFAISCNGNTSSASTKNIPSNKTNPSGTPVANPSIPGEPDIDFDSRSLDLGIIDAGGRKEVVIKVYNRGDKDLLIKQINSSCGCTSTLLGDKGPIKPKGSQELKITIESKEGKPIAPKSRITITSNDPAEPTCTLDTSLTIKTYFDIEPKTLNLGQVLQGEQIQSQFIVFSPEKEVIRIKKLVCADPHVQLTIGEPTMVPNKNLPGIIIKVAVDTKHRAVGNLRGTVEVHLEHEKQKVVPMNLFGIINGEIFLKTGDRVMNVPIYDLGTISNARGPVPLVEIKKLRVALHEKSTRSQIKVLQIIGESGPFQLEAISDANSRQVEISFINNGTFRPGLFRQQFKLLVNHPSVPILEFCLQGTLQSSLNLSSEGFYIETPPNQPFEQKISIRQNLQAPPKLEIHGGKFLQYELVPDGNSLWLVAKSTGCERTMMEEIEVRDLTSGQGIPVTVWVEVIP